MLWTPFSLLNIKLRSMVTLVLAGSSTRDHHPIAFCWNYTFMNIQCHLLPNLKYREGTASLEAGYLWAGHNGSTGICTAGRPTINGSNCRIGHLYFTMMWQGAVLCVHYWAHGRVFNTMIQQQLEFGFVLDSPWTLAWHLLEHVLGASPWRIAQPEGHNAAVTGKDFCC